MTYNQISSNQFSTTSDMGEGDFDASMGSLQLFMKNQNHVLLEIAIHMEWQNKFIVEVTRMENKERPNAQKLIKWYETRKGQNEIDIVMKVMLAKIKELTKEV